mgnify:CR=1 FL=1
MYKYKNLKELNDAFVSEELKREDYFFQIDDFIAKFLPVNGNDTKDLFEDRIIGDNILDFCFLFELELYFFMPQIF